MMQHLAAPATRLTFLQATHVSLLRISCEEIDAGARAKHHESSKCRTDLCQLVPASPSAGNSRAACSLGCVELHACGTLLHKLRVVQQILQIEMEPFLTRSDTRSNPKDGGSGQCGRTRSSTSRVSCGCHSCQTPCWCCHNASIGCVM